MKKFLVRYVLGVALLLGFVWNAFFSAVPFLEQLDDYIYDVKVRLFAPGSVDDRVVIVDIDERSLAEEGRWPWGRDKVATMVRQLTDHYKAKVIGFDVVFAEPDTSSGINALDRLSKQQLRESVAFQNAYKGLRPSLDHDGIFAEVLKTRPVVLGYYFNPVEKRRYGVLPLPSFNEGGVFAGKRIDFIQNKGYGGNLQIFQEAAMNAGHFNPDPDVDGVTRRIALLVEYEGGYYESLSLAVFRRWAGNLAIRPVIPDAEGGIEALELISGQKSWHVPVNNRVSALVPYRGGEGSFPYVSATDVLKGKVSPALLADKIVLVGTRAPGLKDLRATPVGGVFPGVEIHANMIAGMIEGNIKQQPDYVKALDALQIIFAGGLLVFLLPLLSPVRATLLALASVTGILGANILFWNGFNLSVPMAGVLLLSLILYGVDAAWGYFVESRSKRQFTDLFGQYVPPELVDEMAKNPETYSMEGKKEELTVLFSDVRGFTTISEGLDPSELAQLMNAYLGKMTTVIRKHRGTLDKYIGDAIMAFWGAPVSNAEHARESVLAALEMQSALRELDEPFKARGWPALQIGIGINSGPMTVGDMGSPIRKAYTVMGDAVNLASRLESITKQYGIGILVGESTKAKVQDVLFREVDRVRVKGKDEPVVIYEPLALASAASEETQGELKLWQQALRLYRAQDWDAAELQLINLLRQAPECKLYKVYIDRITYYRASPPGECWDGVMIYETK